MNRTLRTFVAVEVSPEVRSRAAQLIQRLDQAPAKVKWVEPENMHFTLKFLGEVELLVVPQICQAVASAVVSLKAFELVARGAGAFPDPNRPRTVWLGVSQGASQMVELHAAIEQALDGLGFRREQRRFRPHLTVGRVRGLSHATAELGRLLGQHADYAAGVTSVDEVLVLSSELGRQGPVYETLCTAPLEG